MNLERLVLFLTVVAMSMLLISAKPTRRQGKNRPKKGKQARIEAIKKDILRKLGLKGVPKIKPVNMTIEEKRRMIRMYKKSIEETNRRFRELYSGEEYVAKNFNYFTDYGSARISKTNSSRNPSEEPTRIYFDVNIAQPGDPKKEVAIHKAQLKLYKSAVNPENLRNDSNVDNTISVNVYQIMRKKRKKKKKTRKLIDSKVINLAYIGWEHFNIKEAVMNWVNNPGSNLGIEIESDAQRLHDVVTFAKGGDIAENYNGDEEDVSPGLSVLSSERYILGKSKGRAVKEDCVKGDGEKKCCRHPLYISFKDIGWDDWVVEPAGYNAYYCDGKCPRRYKMANTFSGIKSILKMTNPGAAPSPCCTATKFSPLPILHLDEHGNYGVTEYSDMIVEECRCA